MKWLSNLLALQLLLTALLLSSGCSANRDSMLMRTCERELRVLSRGILDFMATTSCIPGFRSADGELAVDGALLLSEILDTADPVLRKALSEIRLLNDGVSDPWGKPLRFEFADRSAQQSTGSGSTTLFIISSGPNRRYESGRGDDLWRPVCVPNSWLPRRGPATDEDRDQERANVQHPTSNIERENGERGNGTADGADERRWEGPQRE
jgi:hypothetical protein